MTAEEQVLKMYNDLRNDPSVNQDFFKLLKKKWPNMSIPEVDVPARLEAEQLAREEERNKKIKELEERLLEQDVRNRLASERGKIKGPPFNISDEEMTRVEELIEKKGFPTYEAAAEYYRAVTAPLKPTGFMSQVPRPEIKKAKDLLKDPKSDLFKSPKSWSDNEFDNAWSDVETGKVAFQ
jgi:hypothetical protein